MMRVPTGSPPPSWGRAREGGIAERLPLVFPPPLTPPHKGEGNWRDDCREGSA
jgi:hypothetical protein